MIDPKIDFIVFGLQPWDFEMGSNCKNLALEIAKKHRVLYVNRPIERSNLYAFKNDDKIKNRLNALKNGVEVLEMKSTNLWVFNPKTILESINWLPAGKLYHVISKMNAKRLANQINWAMQHLQFNRSVLFIDNDFLKGYYLNDYLKAETMVYYIRDFLLSQPYFAKHGKEMEPGIMTKADVVVANSLYLAEYSKQFNSDSFDVGQGCELEEFVKGNYEVPDDMKSIKGPIIGYCGALLEMRLDIKLIFDIANKRKDWKIVLVGPEDKAFKCSDLHSLDNVYFLGSKSVESLPSYVHQFDVCINPQVLNQMTIGNYPRKIDEYLAAGKPIVATKTRAMEMFKEYCSLVSSSDEYICEIEKILHSGEQKEEIERRRKFALSHTWESSTEAIYAAIAVHLN